MLRVLPAVLVAIAAAVAAHLLGLPPVVVALIGVLGAGAVGGLAVLRRDRALLPVGGRAPIAARGDLAGFVGAAFPVFIAWVLANLLLNPDVFNAPYSPGATSNFSPVLTLVLIVLLGSTAYLVVRRAPRSLRRAPRPAIALAVVLTVLLAVKLAVGWALLKVPGFDAGIVEIAAYKRVFPDADVAPFDSGILTSYLGMYPNNLVLTQLWNVLFSVAAQLGVTDLRDLVAVALVVNVLALTLVELLVFLVARRLWSTRTAFLALGATALFTTLSPWLTTPYSDTLGMVFPIGLLHLWLRLRSAHRRWSRVLLAALVGVVAAVGIAIKPTVLFAVLAIVAVEVVRSRRALKRRGTVLVALSLAGVSLVSGVGTSVSMTAAVNSSGIVPFDVFTWGGGAPITHFMKMGAQGSGGYSWDDVVSTFSLPEAQRSPEALKTYYYRVREMGPEGYPLFLGQKALRAFGDGSFFLGQEGENFPDYFWSNPVTDELRTWYQRDGSNHVYLASLWQAAWVLLLLAASLPVARFAPPAQRRAIDTTRLALLALLLFLLLFESRSRYVYLYLPFVVVMATGLLHALPAAIASWRSRWLPRATRAERPVAALVAPAERTADERASELVDA